jgi:hypothetical protein
MTTGGVAIADSSGAAVFIGPGSQAYELLAMQMFQQRLMQQRYAMAMQQQAARQQDLAARRERAEKSRGDVAARRQRMYAYLAAKYGGSRSTPAPSYVAAYSAGGR